MHRIVISGYYGFNNIGDESILKAVVENLQERLRRIEIAEVPSETFLPLVVCHGCDCDRLPGHHVRLVAAQAQRRLCAGLRPRAASGLWRPDG